MSFNLDQEIPRTGTNSVKWETIFKGDVAVPSNACDEAVHGDNRLLPMWVADMDFCCPPAVIEAIIKRAEHGIFGYTLAPESYFQSFRRWVKRRHDWDVPRDWIVLTAGIVPALHMLVSTFVKPGEKVLIQRPVYYPFVSAIQNNDAVVLSNSLVLENGRYTMDFDDLAAKAADPAVKMIILSSPHNPVGRVWSREELTRLGEICLANDVLVVADEIHSDLICQEATFVPFASISEEFAQHSISCMAPSKTFNLAGLKTSNILIADPDRRQKYNDTLMRNAVYGTNCFGVVAAEAAYNHGDEWLDAVMAYVEGNFHYVEDYLAEHLPQLSMLPLEGTYLAWMDCRVLEMEPDAQEAFFLEEARLFLDQGDWFGEEGKGFLRLNLACPRSIVMEAMARLKTAVTTRLVPAFAD